MRKAVFKSIFLALTIVLMIGLTLGLNGCNDKPDNSTTPPASECTHVWSAWVTVKEAQCEEVGLTQRYCTVCSYTESQPVNALGHTEVLDEAVAPTCTEAGKTQGKHCAACSKIFVAQKSVDALGHKEVFDAPVPPTCTETGLAEGKHCSTCGDILIAQTQIAASGHNYTTIVTEPTATENGQTNYICSACGDSYADPIVPIAFTVTSKNRSTVGFTNQENENLIIPAVFQDKGIWYRVTAIDASAFYWCNKLTSITIPDSVTSIGKEAFLNCEALISIKIPDSVMSIGDYAFCNCGALTSITLPDSITSIGKYAFYYCRALESITIPDSVTNIGDHAFYECRGLTNVTIGAGIKVISDYAFYNCQKLKKITFKGTIEQWNAISLQYEWKFNVPATEIVCSDGKVYLDGKVIYTVTILDGNGNPIEGVQVQLQVGYSAMTLDITDENGVTSTDRVTPRNYVVRITKADGYISEYSKEYHFEDGSTSIVITLQAEEVIPVGYTPIRNKNDLSSISLDGNYILLCDIDLEDTEWSPFGSESTPFTGVFDGNGYCIKNFRIVSSTTGSCSGFFGYNSGLIKNLGIENLAVMNYSSYSGGLVGINASTITNCYVIGEISSRAEIPYVGGLVGSNTGVISNCYTLCDVASNATYDSRASAGGLVGENRGNISNSYTYGTVYAFSDYMAYAGGIVGYSESGNITNCFAIGKVQAISNKGSRAGGITGTSVYAENCWYGEITFWVQEGNKPSSQPTNIRGAKTDLATLKTVAFQTERLGWEMENWAFIEGQLPALKKQ